MEALAAMPRYEAYKDSGFELLGSIPMHWRVHRIKSHVNLLTGFPFNSAKYTLTGIKLVRGINVKEGVINWKDTVFWPEAEAVLTQYLLKNGDILISMDGSKVGKNFCQVSDLDSLLLLVQRVARLRTSSELYNRYLFWNIASDRFLRWVNMSKTDPMVPHISPKDINNYQVPLPPIVEQKSIASFLDQKAAQLNEAITIKEKQVELLKEYKQLIIQKAVTQGLDPNVPMKDSGVDWIGEIPEHWEVKRAKYLFDEVDERSISGTEELLSVSHMTGVTPRSEKNVSMFMAEDYSGSKLCRKNDLVMNIMWAWMGALGVSDRLGIVSPSYGVFRQSKAKIFHSVYLEYLLKMPKYIEYYNKVSTGLHSSRLRFYGHMFFAMKLGFPSYDEQLGIVGYLEKITGKIDQSLSVQQEQIKKLKEYKTTLINSAVTGKIKIS